jgi:hypothetical protein
VQATYLSSTNATKSAALLCLLLLVSGLDAFAQTQAPDPWEQGRVRIGPVAFTPSVVLKNLGWDSNVLNETVDPKKDFTVTAGGLADWWMRVGKVRLTGTESVDEIYYATYASQRGLNHRHDARIEYRLNRLRPYALGSYASIKDRPGYEIDARARHTETAIGAGLEVRVTGKTHIDFAGRHTTYRFAGDQVFAGTYLDQILNRKGTFGSATIRYSATPLTTLTLLGEVGQDRFDGSPERDNNSFRIMPGVEFDPFALLKGSARVGFRRLDMLSGGIPDFSGLVAGVDLSYVLLGRTRFSLGVNRDIQYSFEVTRPYYVLTGVSGAVRQGLGGGWDVEARGYNQRLAYREVLSASNGATSPVDHVQSYGAGIGRRLGQGTRIGANIDYYRRRSAVYRYDYDTLRYGLSATYEF